MGLAIRRFARWLIGDESVVPAELYYLCQYREREMVNQLITVTTQRDYYMRCVSSLKEELRIQRLVGGNRFGGAL